MAIPSYGLGPERLFFPNPLTGSAALLPPTPPATPSAPTGGSLLPALPPLPSSGGVDPSTVPTNPFPTTLEGIMERDRQGRSLPGTLINAAMPFGMGAFTSFADKTALMNAARELFGDKSRPFFSAENFWQGMPGSQSVADYVAAMQGAGGYGTPGARGIPGLQMDFIDPGVAGPARGQAAQSAVPSLADIAASLAGWVGMMEPDGGGTDPGGGWGDSVSGGGVPGEAGGGGIW